MAPKFLSFLSKGYFILLTGFTGFLGVPFLRTVEFIQQNWDLNVTFQILTRNKNNFLRNHPWLRFVSSFDVLECDLRHQRMDFTGVSHCIHGACPSAVETFAGMKATLKYDTILKSAESVCDALNAEAMSKFIFLSSGAVYGDLEACRSAIRETDAIGLDPVNRNRELHTLGISKLAAEHFCDLRCEQNNWTFHSLRLFSFIGPNIPQSVHYAAGNFLRFAQNNQSIQINGNPKLKRSYLYVVDHALWLLCALCMDGNQKIYNVGSDQAVTMLELANKVSRLSEKNLPVLTKQTPSAEGRLYIPNVDSFKKSFGVDVYTDLDHSIKLSL